MKLLRILAVLSMLTAFAPAALLTDPVDAVTYGIWTYKWKDLTDTLYLHKIKQPYLYSKLSGMTTASPFITSYDLGFGAPIAGFGTIALAAAAYERTTTHNLYVTNYHNQVNGSTNVVDTDLNPARNFYNNGLDASAGFSTKIGDAYFAFQYIFSGIQIQDIQRFDTMTPKQISNSVLLGNYAKTVTGTYSNLSTIKHTVSVGMEAAPFEAQLFASLSDVNGSFNFTNGSRVSTMSSNSTVASSGTGGDFESAATSTIQKGLINYANAAALPSNPTTVLKHQLLDFSFSPRVWNILEAKWYLEGNFKTAIFDDANNHNSLQTITEMKAIDGTTTNKLDSKSDTAFGGTYTEVGGNVRMKKVWKGEKASFGLYPRVIAQYQTATMSRTLSSNQNTLTNTTTATVTNYTAATDTKSLEALNWDLRLPVGVEWKVDKFLTLYASTRARLQINDSTVKTVEKNGDAISSAVTHETTAITRTLQPILTGTYHLGFVWSPSDVIEFALTLNSGNTFLSATPDFFAGADISAVLKF